MDPQCIQTRPNSRPGEGAANPVSSRVDAFPSKPEEGIAPRTAGLGAKGKASPSTASLWGGRGPRIAEGSTALRQTHRIGRDLKRIR